MPDFTKGKWRYEECAGYKKHCSYRIRATRKETGATVNITTPITDYGKIPENERLANARLIAAAPELFDELYSVLGYLYAARVRATNTQYKLSVMEDIKRIKALLARIEGEEELS